VALTRKPDPTPGERSHLRADGMAKMAMTKSVAKRAARNHGPESAVYRCPVCNAWHIATVKP
jgi:hypothetical protein